MQIDQETKRTINIPFLGSAEKEAIMREKYLATMKPVSCLLLQGEHHSSPYHFTLSPSLPAPLPPPPPLSFPLPSLPPPLPSLPPSSSLPPSLPPPLPLLSPSLPPSLLLFLLPPLPSLPPSSAPLGAGTPRGHDLPTP